MSVTRLNHFQAKPDKVDTLRVALEGLLPQIRASDGCESAHLMKSTEKEGSFVVVEVWASAEAHRASFQQATPQQVEALLALLDGAPTGAYYEVLE